MELKDLVPIGAEVFFEYHCLESEASADAELWHQTHQQVTVLSRDDDGGDYSETLEKRIEMAEIIMYRVRFADGFESDVFEDELMFSESDYCRPDPPSKSEKGRRPQFPPANLY